MQGSSDSSVGRRGFPWHIVVFLAPATIVYTMFMVYPLLDSMRLSFFATDRAGQEFFVGLQNYVTLFTDDLWQPRLWGAFWHNVVFFLIHMIVQNSIGLLLAALLTSRTVRAAGGFRTVFFLPTMLSVVIVGFIWKLILSPLWGVAEGMLSLVGLESLFKPWLGLEGPALVALALISVWQFIGIPMMLFFAALISIPDELIEASTVDGANGWQVFWRIKFPLILPVVGIVAVLTFVGNFNAFDLIYTTQGALAGPNYSTDIMGTFFYRTFFGQQLQLGNPTMGAAVATVMFLIILAGVLLYMFGYQRRVQSYEL
ncbi:MAG: sugar ABC transporter permease [Chloroflexota bacterium]|nr:sugar ABC transporter permease [Chloroflexota bacterium]